MAKSDMAQSLLSGHGTDTEDSQWGIKPKGSIIGRLYSWMGTIPNKPQHAFQDDIHAMNGSSTHNHAGTIPMKIHRLPRICASRILKRAVLLLPIAALTAL